MPEQQLEPDDYWPPKRPRYYEDTDVGDRDMDDQREDEQHLTNDNNE